MLDVGGKAHARGIYEHGDGVMSRDSSARDQSVPKATKTDRIVSEMRRMIQEGEIPRGTRVHQEALAEKFQTSITPVREALRLLEAEGILVGEPRRGVRVANADFTAIKSIYLQRRLIEPYAMCRAARRVSARDFDHAELLLDRMEKLQGRGSADLMPAVNREFHFLFYDRCGNEGLRALIDNLWQQWPWDLLRVIDERAASSPLEHRGILEAVRHGDAELIAQTTSSHLTASYLHLAQHITGHDSLDPFDVDAD